MRRAKRHPFARRRGFTLIEAIATIVVLSAVGTGVSMIFLSAIQSYVDGATAAQLHAELSIAMDRIARELRMTPLDTGASGIAPDINTVTASSLAWDDVDGEATSLALAGSNVTLAVDGGAPFTLLSDVTSFTVQTYDESNAALAASLSGAACDPIRRVEVSITTARNGVSQSLRSRVYLRSTLAGAGS